MNFRCMIVDRIVDIEAKTTEEAYERARQDFLRWLLCGQLEIIVWDWPKEGHEQRLKRGRL